MVLGMVCLRADCRARPGTCQSAARACRHTCYSHPGMSMGSASASDDEKHSTSAISESEDATNAPSAAGGTNGQ